MALNVIFSEDPSLVLKRAGEFLASQPVFHNVVLTILHGRVVRPEPGRYWVTLDGEKVVGVTVQSPVTFAAALVPMERRVAMAMADAIADAGIRLPGVNGDAATAASFAGQWMERCKSGATPFQGNRLYELMELGEAPAVGGELRQAGARDRELMLQWSSEFQAEVGTPQSASDIEHQVDAALEDGLLWIWEGGETVSMAANRPPVVGVARVAGVYTPQEKRGRGYAAACVHALSKQLREQGHRCILYTDLHNATSNSIYQRIGYRAVGEALRYRFE